MPDRGARGAEKRRLRFVLFVFFVALVVPTAVLVYHAFGRLATEAFYQHRALAEELANRIDARVRQWIATEEARSLTDYRFLVVEGEAQANFLQRSALSSFPVEASIPGLMSYFQIDADGTFSTPLLPSGVDPAAYGVAAEEITKRRALETQVRALLALPLSADAQQDEAGAASNAERGDAGMPNAEKPDAQKKTLAKDKSAQGVFDRLSESSGQQLGAGRLNQTNQLGRVEDLKLDSKFESRARELDRPAAPAAKAMAEEPRVARKEQAAVPIVLASGEASAKNPAAEAPRVRTFDGELDPFVFSRLDADHFVLFRKVWLDGQRLIQGAVIAQKELLEGLVDAPFMETGLSQTSDLTIAYRGELIGAAGVSRASGYPVSKAGGELLYRAPLSSPLNDIELIFSVTDLPVGPGGRIVGWATLVLAIVLLGGLMVVYRFGAAQIDLTRQQQDFVAAVSHELKTPLTSIRMYGEILRAGWASEEKKKTYYDFIFHESERLSRLIANVLRLARLTRNGDAMDVRPATASELLSLVESKIASQVEQAGFRLEIKRDAQASSASIAVDADSLVQILINLVDNALKFSAHAPHKVVEIGCTVTQADVAFRVRDHGPGIAPRHLRRIFELFYRGEDELTRETTGTGIGLALVSELTTAMGGRVGVRNCEPGAEFTVTFPRVKSA